MTERIPPMEIRLDRLEKDMKEFERWQRKQDTRLNAIETHQATEIHIIRETITNSLAPFSNEYSTKIKELDSRITAVELEPHKKSSETNDRIKWIILGAIIPTIVSIVLAKIGII